MAKPVYADVPKFKVIERSLRLIVGEQKKVVEAMRAAKATSRERECLDAAIKECDVAMEHMRKAQAHLYEAF